MLSDNDRVEQAIVRRGLSKRGGPWKIPQQTVGPATTFVPPSNVKCQNSATKFPADRINTLILMPLLFCVCADDDSLVWCQCIKFYCLEASEWLVISWQWPGLKHGT